MKLMLQAILLTIFGMSLFSATPARAQYQSLTVCQAQTVCPNGVPIYCRVFGAQALGWPGLGAGAQACQWWVVPGQAVRCSGYVQQLGPWGYQWVWADFPLTCF